MPLKLVPPRPGNPNWQIRGSYLHVKRLFRSSGTPERKVAEQALKKLKRDIESGAFAQEAGPTFAGAVTSYLRAGGDDTFCRRLLEHFQMTPLARITQAAIDAAADALYPDSGPATRNRAVYTPVSAILKHAGVETKLKRPKGARGKLRLHWLRQEEAFALLAAAEALEPRFGALLAFLLYTGCRLSEGLRLKWKDVDLQASFAYVSDTKNGDPRPVFLPPVVTAALANLEKTHATVFGYTKGRLLYEMLDRAEKASGVTIPDGISFHIWRHTYGAWLRRYAGMDTSGLVATGAWKSKQAASIYEHAEFSEEATKAALLPVREVNSAPQAHSSPIA
jgi:integrase